ncbi:MAG: hypothetical protein D6706_08245 [Chloroflexi bacterium]|nr:MAG: hypothetical protein D6706_08245 [Chloroflexota bacterium]
MKNKIRYVIPNAITFTSLTCGIVSILLSASGNLQPAGVLVLTSYILDLFDGAAARKLRAGTAFGLQLDSLVDMVSLGTAPAVLFFMHMTSRGVPPVWLWISAVAIPLAGAYRLARFNLLPPKESGDTDSVGLTISTGGAVLALAVLAELSQQDSFLPVGVLVGLALGVSVLMVSRIPFPSFFWVFSNWRRNVLLVILFGISLQITTLFNAWFFWTNAYLGVSLARAGLRNRR